MLISEKQHDANLQNAQHSCGPTTEAGKEAVRYNALKYGLRTRATILPEENERRYCKLWDEFEAEWQPQTRTERAYLETMVTSQWLLRRMAWSEMRIQMEIEFGPEQFKMLSFVYKQRAQLERAFRNAVADMQKSREKRELREKHQAPEVRQKSQPQPVPPQPIQPAEAVEEPETMPVPRPPHPDPAWIMAPPPGYDNL